MSAIKLIPASGGGSVSLAPPNSTSGADVTFTLPSTSQSFGKILQVVQTVKTDTSSVGAQYDSPADLGISCAITPTYASSKILVDCCLNIGGQDMFGIYLFLVRGSTNILLGDAAGSRTRASKYIDHYDSSGSNDEYNSVDVNIKYLDSPTYSVGDTITYKIQSAAYSANRNVYLNRNHNDRDSADYSGRGTSTITLMEVAA